jgi:iron complex transport system substrate-binding protein
VGSYNRLDIEAILAQRPDLVIGWISGNSPDQLKRIEELGITVYRSEQRSIEDIAKSLERIGKLAGSAAEAAREAADLRARVAQLRQRYASREPVGVFYQVWQDPIITVNGKQLISESIRICGGRNVFAHLDRLTPRLNVESVVAADPQAIVAGGMGEANDAWLNRWREYADMTAVKEDNLFFVPPSLLQRPTPRLLKGTAQLCRKLDQAR